MMRGPIGTRTIAGDAEIAPAQALTAWGEGADPLDWQDPKRYAWIFGLVVPLLPFIAWGLVSATGLGVFWFIGPALVFGSLPGV